VENYRLSIDWDELLKHLGSGGNGIDRNKEAIEFAVFVGVLLSSTAATDRTVTMYCVPQEDTTSTGAREQSTGNNTANE
jgi:hypothetical protein